MSRKVALLISSALTAFVLVTMAGMALVLRAPEVTGAEAAAPPAAPADVALAVGVGIETYQQREQLYRQRLEEANQRLEVASRQISQLQAPRPAPQGARPSEQPLPPARVPEQPRPGITDSMVSRDQAAQAALEYVGGGRVEKMELEREHGLAFWEVKVKGARVYGEAKVRVDAYTGQVAYASRDD